MLVFIIGLLALSQPATADCNNGVPHNLTVVIPDDFIFGTATSAYQVKQTQRAEDLVSGTYLPMNLQVSLEIKDHSNGDVAVDFYNRYKEIYKCKGYGFRCFPIIHFMARVIPSGRRREGVNEEGIEFIMMNDFRDYADLLFDKFGDRVKHWMTFNEPWALSGFAYDDGVFAPGRCSSWVNRQCRAGNSQPLNLT
ncbi:hypothetical protein GH714_015998 [Hevea brasiliensis]|uniref:Uncharacterized protein n=1 Tax=Hevea brasiliensis TaxID=3981 RepID=A0A6A6N3M5_HEVBR|nr:hypothetical protein GH714_015998 [Hevea brasiliensis]